MSARTAAACPAAFTLSYVRAMTPPRAITTVARRAEVPPSFCTPYARDDGPIGVADEWEGETVLGGEALLRAERVDRDPDDGDAQRVELAARAG